MNIGKKGQTDMVICRRCRQEQSVDEKYCINCGDRLFSSASKSGSSSLRTSSNSLKNSQQWKPKPVTLEPVKKIASTSPATAFASLAEQQQKPKPVSPVPAKNSADVSQGATLGSLVEQQQQKHIRRARAIIMWIAVLTLVGSFILYIFVGTENGLLEGMKNSLELDHKAFNQLKTLMTIEMWVNFFMGAVFLLLFIWARSNPFVAILTVLVIFITQIIVMAAMNPKAMVSPAQIINVLIIIALIKGLKAGLAFNKGKRTALQKR